jgi:hypothetical protein
MAELTVVPAPPAAELAGGRYVQAIALDAADYPTLTVSNLGKNKVEWYLGTVKIGEGSPFTPSTNSLPTNLVGPVTNAVKEVRTHVVRAVMSRENCTNDSTTMTFLVTAPWLSASLSTNTPSVMLHLNAVGDLTGKSVTLYSTNDISLLIPEGDLSPITLTNSVSTTPTGVSSYFVKEISDLSQSLGFFRVRISP